MPHRIINILLIISALALAAPGQANKPNDRELPDQLSENETQAILKETAPKSHVEAALKISDARLASASKSADAHQYKAAIENVDVYASLIIYADRYTRKLPAAQAKDRSHCFKKIEQAIFKQSRNLEAIMRAAPFETRESVEEKVNEVKKIRLRALDDAVGGGKIINSSNRK